MSPTPLALLLIYGLLGRSTAQSVQSIRVDNLNAYTPANQNGIQYSRGWVHISGDDASGRYLNTLSAGTAPNVSAVYFFKGNSVAYYADGLAGDDALLVSVDGFPPEQVISSNVDATQQLLWSKFRLDKEDHQLIFAPNRSAGSQSTGWSITLDYLEVTYGGSVYPSDLGPGATNAPSEFTADDGDERITYQGPWLIMVPTAQQSFYFGGLQHTTSTPGSSLSFSFEGNAVYYFSDKSSDNGVALVSVDGGKGELVDTSLKPGDGRWLSQALCWSKTNLGSGPHTLKITHADQAGKLVSLDFFKYSSSVKKNSKTRTGAIIGGSIAGGLVLFCAVLALWWAYRRRSRARIHQDTSNSDTKDEGAATCANDPHAHNLPFRGEAWNPEGAPNDLQDDARPVDEARDRRDGQPYSGLPEPQTT